MTASSAHCGALIVLSMSLGVSLAAGWSGSAAASETAATPPSSVSTPEAEATEPGPQLSIAIDDGHTSTAAGDALTYAIIVRNLGSSAVSGLQLTQTMPAGVTFVSADAGGAVKADKVSWSLDLSPSGETTVHTTMNVSTTPTDLLRLAPVACATVTADGPPIVCASHSDQLPAGAEADAAKATSQSGEATASTGRTWWYLGAAVLIALALGVVATTLIRRRRAADLETM